MVQIILVRRIMAQATGRLCHSEGAHYRFNLLFQWAGRKPELRLQKTLID